MKTMNMHFHRTTTTRATAHFK